MEWSSRRLLHCPFPIWSFSPFDLLWFGPKIPFYGPGNFTGWDTEPWMSLLNDPLSTRPPIVSLLPIVYLPTYFYHQHLLLSPTPIVSTYCSIVMATCCHLLPVRQTVRRFLCFPLHLLHHWVLAGACRYLPGPAADTVTSRWRHDTMWGLRSSISTT